MIEVIKELLFVMEDGHIVATTVWLWVAMCIILWLPLSFIMGYTEGPTPDASPTWMAFIGLVCAGLITVVSFFITAIAHAIGPILIVPVASAIVAVLLAWAGIKVERRKNRRGN